MRRGHERHDTTQKTTLLATVALAALAWPVSALAQERLIATVGTNELPLRDPPDRDAGQLYDRRRAHLAAAPPPPPVGSTVYATVGPGFRISFHTRRGTRIRRLRAGRYRIIVRDRSRSHSFQLFGRGVNKRTRIRFAGTQTWSVTFRRGYRYRYRCNAHPGRMRGSFRT